MTKLNFSRRNFLKALGFGLSTITANGCKAINSPIGTGTSGKKPNIIFILADDLGWAELGCYGNKFNETPNLDKLASQGMRFTQAYASAPVCSPYAPNSRPGGAGSATSFFFVAVNRPLAHRGNSRCHKTTPLNASRATSTQ